MNQDFSIKFIKAVDSISKWLPKQFEQERMVKYDDIVCALSANYTITEEKKLFGMFPTGQHTHCHEYRMVFAQPFLDEEELKKWWKFICDVQPKLIKLDENHEFSIFSMILICDEITENAQNKLKKLKNDVIFRSKKQGGWSNTRCAVFELKSGKIYVNKGSEPLAKLLKEPLKDL